MPENRRRQQDHSYCAAYSFFKADMQTAGRVMWSVFLFILVVTAYRRLIGEARRSVATRQLAG